MISIVRTIVASLTVASMASTASAATTGPVSAADRAFVAKVSQGGMFEVAAGKVAATQGASQVVRDSGTTESHDHDLVGAGLTQAASSAGITFPKTANAQFAAELSALRDQHGAAFNRLYVSDMLALHAKDGAAFLAESQTGTNPALKAFAAQTYPIVEAHVGELKAISARL